MNKAKALAEFHAQVIIHGRSVAYVLHICDDQISDFFTSIVIFLPHPPTESCRRCSSCLAVLSTCHEARIVLDRTRGIGYLSRHLRAVRTNSNHRTIEALRPPSPTMRRNQNGCSSSNNFQARNRLAIPRRRYNNCMNYAVVGDHDI
jgi:hypothetical protein